MVDGYTFYKTNSSGKLWLCSSYKAGHCKAKIRYKEPNTVIPCYMEHNHSPPKYHLFVSEIEFNYIDTPKGGKLVMIDGYTFSKMNKCKIWTCSNKYSYSCGAKFKMSNNETIIPHCLEHNHPPPTYVVTKDGKYIKV
ncbi:hypothetical protein ABMA27_001350 [Loxostege sticticalis]|uniref:FLYWCH-type domain-containing protein n=1 Tax=Loxostege sticticalis TaxID=481309 RepID=A0ABR3HY71_LOXSC